MTANVTEALRIQPRRPTSGSSHLPKLSEFSPSDQLPDRHTYTGDASASALCFFWSGGSRNVTSDKGASHRGSVDGFRTASRPGHRTPGLTPHQRIVYPTANRHAGGSLWRRIKTQCYHALGAHFDLSRNHALGPFEYDHSDARS